MSLPQVYVDYPNPQSPGASAYADDQDAEDRLNIAALLGFFLRRLRLFVLIVIAVIAASYFMVSRQPEVYQAGAEVVLQGSSRGAPDVLSVLSNVPRGESEVNTEIAVIRSQELASKVIDRLRLMDHPAFNPRAAAIASGRVLEPLDPAAERDLRYMVTDRVRSGLSAVRLGNAYSLRIGYRHSNPDIAAMLANGYAEAYVNEQRDVKRITNERTAEFLAERIEELREQAQSDVAAVQQYRIENNLLSTRGASLTEQDISAINQSLASARARAARDAAELATAREELAGGSAGDDISSAMSSGVIASLRGQRAALTREEADLAGRYGERHPELQRVRRQLADVDSQIQTEIDRVISSLEVRAQASTAEVRSLEQSQAAARANLERNNRAMVILDDLERQAETSQGLYESYLNSYKETVAREGIEEPDARILSVARVPGRPSEPKVALTMVFGTIFALGAGLATSYLVEVTFRGLTTRQEVEDRLRVPYLGVMPDNKSFKPRGPGAYETVAQLNRSPLSEALSSVAATIRLGTSPRPRIVLVTSALPDEGKSNFAATYGAVCSDRGEKIVVVDCDGRRAGLRAVRFGGDRRSGIEDLLTGRTTLDETLVFDEETGCSFLPLNRPIDGDIRRVKDGAFEALLARLKERFDTIILDGPPLLPVTEARELASLADFVILAVRWRKTSSNAAHEAIRLLPVNVAHKVGVVLTKVNLRRQARYAFGDQHYYFNKYHRYYAPTGRKKQLAS